jgi:hypothetical protein
MAPDELEPYPEAGVREYARAGIEAGIAAVPVVGGPLEVLVDAVLAPSLAKRRDRWFQTLADLVSELQTKIEGFDVEALAGDEVFVTSVVEASRIAMGTHREEKLLILKNCLVHMALAQSRDDFFDLQLFRFVDEMAPEHFLVLQYFANPSAWYESKGIRQPNIFSGSPGAIMDTAELPVAGAALGIVIRDLSDRGLINSQSLRTVMTAAGAWQALATELGNQLLRFVSELEV